MRIVLIGFMGSGKTTVGKMLARRLKIPFFDLDDYIEKKEKKTISELFDSAGEKKFRSSERKFLNRLLKKKLYVISAGGGTPCFFDNMSRIKEKAVSIYLKPSRKQIFDRLSEPKRIKSRPLLRDLSPSELKQFISKTMNERERFYFQADYVIRAGKQDARELVLSILKVLKSKAL